MDVGCGSGAWAIEIANEFRNANVIGIDLFPIQPTDVPQNCEFIVADLNQGLDFDDGSMDSCRGGILLSLFLVIFTVEF